MTETKECITKPVRGMHKCPNWKEGDRFMYQDVVFTVTETRWNNHFLEHSIVAKGFQLLGKLKQDLYVVLIESKISERMQSLEECKKLFCAADEPCYDCPHTELKG